MYKCKVIIVKNLDTLQDRINEVIKDVGKVVDIEFDSKHHIVIITYL